VTVSCKLKTATIRLNIILCTKGYPRVRLHIFAESNHLFSVWLATRTTWLYLQLYETVLFERYQNNTQRTLIFGWNKLNYCRYDIKDRAREKEMAVNERRQASQYQTSVTDKLFMMLLTSVLLLASATTAQSQSTTLQHYVFMYSWFINLQ